MKKYVSYHIEILQDNNDDESEKLGQIINESSGQNVLRGLKPTRLNREENYKAFNELVNSIMVDFEKPREFNSHDEANLFNTMLTSIALKAMKHMGHTKVSVTSKLTERNGKIVSELKSSHEKKRSLKGRPLNTSSQGNEHGKGNTKA